MRTLTYHPDTRTTVINDCDEAHVLEHLQHEVDGYVECIQGELTGLEGIDLWINDEGAVNDLPHAFTIKMNHYPIPLFGNVVFARHDDNGDTIALTDDDIKAITARLNRPTA